MTYTNQWENPVQRKHTDKIISTRYLFFSDKKKLTLINGQDYGPNSAEFDYVDDPSTEAPVIDGESMGDEVHDTAEDPAYYGKEIVSSVSSNI